MLAFPHSVRIFVAVLPVDMRKSFNGLWAAASEQLHEDPKSGAVFCFINKERTRLKLLYWDGTGVWGAGEAAGAGPLLVAGAEPGRHETRPRTGSAGAARRRDRTQARLAEGVVRALKK